MLVLTRKPSQIIDIGPEITVTVVRIDVNTVRLGIDAPKHVDIVRREVAERKGASGGQKRSGKEEEGR